MYPVSRHPALPYIQPSSSAVCELDPGDIRQECFSFAALFDTRLGVVLRVTKSSELRKSLLAEESRPVADEEMTHLKRVVLSLESITTANTLPAPADVSGEFQEMEIIYAHENLLEFMTV